MFIAGYCHLTGECYVEGATSECIVSTAPVLVVKSSSKSSPLVTEISMDRLYKSFKVSIDTAVREDGRAIVAASWVALRAIVRGTVNEDAPKGATTHAEGKRIGAKNIAWSHVADAWGVTPSMSINPADPHYAAIRAQALAFRVAVVAGTGNMLTAAKVEKALLLVASDDGSASSDDGCGF
jgi:hypothetical protein